MIRATPVITGAQNSVRDFVNVAAKELGMNIRWEGSGLDEKGYDHSGKSIAGVDPRYFRPTEVETLIPPNRMGRCGSCWL